ncbi:MAG: glycosyltransferase family 2 protein [Bacteroidota bacterium]
MKNLKEYKTRKGELLLYTGDPDLGLLEELAVGPGDLWHSSLDRGYKAAFPELTYQMAVFWWFLNDFEDLERSINWRIDPHAFVVRKEVWEIFKGFPGDYTSQTMKAFDLGFRLLRFGGGIPMCIKGLYPEINQKIEIPGLDRYIFFLKNFKKEHSLNMLLKKGVKHPLKEFKFFRQANSKNLKKNKFPLIPPRKLLEIEGLPTVSVIIPTMFRQDYTLQLLEDYNLQSYSVTEVIVIDATPEESRDPGIYKNEDFSFDLIVRWQRSKGSCRARNEAIKLCKGDYIIFADDDTRIPSNFVENHLKLLQTYNVEACNGLDIHAPHFKDGLSDLERALQNLGDSRWRVGAAQTFSNANSCVRRDWVMKLKGNDINFDGGYGEDSDFGFSIFHAGAVVLFNPFSANLHLKPPSGGYRHWSLQSSIMGKKRKMQPWELDHPVKYIKPVPSPTIMYGILKRFTPDQIREYRSKYLFLYLYKNRKRTFLFRLARMPYKILQFNRSVFYAKNLLKRGPQYD